jgi:hypothetical protein
MAHPFEEVRFGDRLPLDEAQRLSLPGNFEVDVISAALSKELLQTLVQGGGHFSIGRRHVPRLRLSSDSSDNLTTIDVHVAVQTSTDPYVKS